MITPCRYLTRVGDPVTHMQLSVSESKYGNSNNQRFSKPWQPSFPFGGAARGGSEMYPPVAPGRGPYRQAHYSGRGQQQSQPRQVSVPVSYDPRVGRGGAMEGYRTVGDEFANPYLGQNYSSVSALPPPPQSSTFAFGMRPMGPMFPSQNAEGVNLNGTALSTKAKDFNPNSGAYVQGGSSYQVQTRPSVPAYGLVGWQTYHFHFHHSFLHIQRSLHCFPLSHLSTRER